MVSVRVPLAVFLSIAPRPSRCVSHRSAVPRSSKGHIRRDAPSASLRLDPCALRLPFSIPAHLIPRSKQFKNTEHAANLFALKELGNIYSRLMNPTTHVLESRVAQLEGGHPLSAVAVASGTSAVFYAIINLAQAGDNIVASSKLYGGTYTQFNDILPTFGITVKFVDAEPELPRGG